MFRRMRRAGRREFRQFSVNRSATLKNTRKTNSLRLMESASFLQHLGPRRSGLCASTEHAQNGAPVAGIYAWSFNIWRPCHRALCAFESRAARCRGWNYYPGWATPKVVPPMVMVAMRVCPVVLGCMVITNFPDCDPPITPLNRAQSALDCARQGHPAAFT